MKIKSVILLLLFLLSSSCQTPLFNKQAPLFNKQAPPRGVIQQGSLLYNSPEMLSRPYVLLISIDGYRYDYTKKISPPTLSKFIQKGIHAEGLIPIFPSITFPNHYSIVTGLRADKHGIVNNSFWDPQRKKTYTMKDRHQVEDGQWYQGEPLWVAANKQKMVSASYFWVGSEANIQGLHPSYWVPYKHETPNRQRVKQVLKWFQMPAEKRPHFVTLYFSDVDSAGHAYGPDSEPLKKAVLNVDQELGFLLDGLKKINLDIHVIIVSDHGMEKIPSDKIFYLTDYIDLNDSIKYEGRGSFGNLYTSHPSITETIYNKLKKVPHLDVYRKGELPKDYGYSNSPRIGDLILSVHSPYYMKTSRPPLNQAKANFSMKGNHGYNPFLRQNKNMQGIFYAQGPQILNKGEIPAFQNIHIYPFIMELLGLEIQTEIDGKKAVLSSYLKRKKEGVSQANTKKNNSSTSMGVKKAK